MKLLLLKALGIFRSFLSIAVEKTINYTCYLSKCGKLTKIIYNYVVCRSFERLYETSELIVQSG